MTAEWPRGKVQKLCVGEDGFDLGGRQYQFRHGQVRQFAWEDGTIQSVQSIQKTLGEVYKRMFLHVLLQLCL